MRWMLLQGVRILCLVINNYVQNLNKAEREGLTMALVEFSITVQTGEFVNDPLKRDDIVELDNMLNGMKTVVNCSKHDLEIASWEELNDE